MDANERDELEREASVALMTAADRLKLIMNETLQPALSHTQLRLIVAGTKILHDTLDAAAMPGVRP